MYTTTSNITIYVVSYNAYHKEGSTLPGRLFQVPERTHSASRIGIKPQQYAR